MGRPSLKEKRQEEILLAYEKSVARYGVEGATLEKIAQEAGLARALLRHHVGNREELLKGLIKRFFDRSHTQMHELFEALPQENRLTTLVEWLFDPDYANPQQVLVAEALISAAADRPELKEKVLAWLEDFTALFSKEIKRAHPNASEQNCKAVAVGLIGIYFNADSLSPLGRLDEFSQLSKQAALRLLTTLEK